MPDPRIVTTFILVVVFLGSLLFSDWGNLVSHGGGGAMIRLMGKGLISLELSYGVGYPTLAEAMGWRA